MSETLDPTMGIAELLRRAPEIQQVFPYDLCYANECPKVATWAMITQGHKCSGSDCKGDIAVFTCDEHKELTIALRERNETVIAERLPIGRKH